MLLKIADYKLLAALLQAADKAFMPGIQLSADEARRASKNEQTQPQKLDPKMASTLVALAPQGEPVLSTIKDTKSAGRRRKSGSRLLPGGQDARLTPQVRFELAPDYTSGKWITNAGQ